MVALYTPCGYLSTFFLGLEENGCQHGKDHRCGDAAGGSGEAAGEDAYRPLFRHGLGHALGKTVSEAGEGDGGAGAAPVHQILIDAHRLQKHSGHHIAGEDAGGGQLGAVDEQLAGGAEDAAAEKCVQVIQGLHSFLCGGKCHRMTDAGDGLPLKGGGGAQQRPGGGEEQALPAALPQAPEQVAVEHGGGASAAGASGVHILLFQMVQQLEKHLNY